MTATLLYILMTISTAGVVSYSPPMSHDACTEVKKIVDKETHSPLGGVATSYCIPGGSWVTKP